MHLDTLQTNLQNATDKKDILEKVNEALADGNLTQNRNPFFAAKQTKSKQFLEKLTHQAKMYG